MKTKTKAQRCSLLCYLTDDTWKQGEHQNEKAGGLNITLSTYAQSGACGCKSGKGALKQPYSCTTMAQCTTFSKTLGTAVYKMDAQ